MPTSKIALRGALLIDGTGKDPVEKSLVLIEGKNIVYSGQNKNVDSDYQVVDISDAVIIPGLIDTHLHFCGNLSSDDNDWVLEPLFQKAVVSSGQAQEALENGLTTVGEISRFGIDLRNMIEVGVIKGPRIITSGLGFCRTCGHGDSHKLSLEYNEESHPWAERVDGPWELRKAVRQRLRQGPDCIKIWATGGGTWRLDRKADQHYTYEEIMAVVEEASMVGLPVWSHAEGYSGAKDSARAGVSCIIHGQELDEETLDIMREKNITFCPTLQFFYEWYSQYEPPYRTILDHFPGNNTAEKELNRTIANFQTAVAKGIRIVVGSDSFCSRLTPYGRYAITEIHTLCKSGLTPMQTIMAATKNGAEMLKVDNITGTIESGKFADLIVLTKNPLDNIENLSTNNMWAIMKEGEVVKGQL
ncbi:amidohydrolase family protein [Desulfosporosinus sp. Sb-LF]|uniref:metal-dependent hydrolase family protein n=1 Tax=Desulfosporosinus sp. Sb-LF TaxID=2560027 RepID=UPI00107FB316|nr:amidohydrolase family protein [Desulfosporosinus sp. Sb-LF]TGE31719.1 amidohydrolase family protein [Desulfosporosinus sp. Sb-LF]